MSVSALAYIGLGSNMGMPMQQLQAAYIALNKLPGTRFGEISNIYQSAAVGPGNQPDYLNAVASLHTELAPEKLLLALQNIEIAQGRTRDLRWGARTLDLDILLYGDLQIRTPDLVIPHAEMYRRSFVLFPLFDLNPALVFPDGKNLRSHLESIDKSSISMSCSAEAFINTCS